jgi:hypothetical protein
MDTARGPKKFINEREVDYFCGTGYLICTAIVSWLKPSVMQPGTMEQVLAHPDPAMEIIQCY